MEEKIRIELYRISETSIFDFDKVCQVYDRVNDIEATKHILLTAHTLHIDPISIFDRLKEAMKYGFKKFEEEGRGRYV